MNEILNRLAALAKDSAALDVSAGQRQQMIDAAGRYAQAFLSGLQDIPVFRDTEEEKDSLRITGQPHTLDQLLDDYQKQVAETGINAASGKHLGYIPGGGVFASSIADFIAAVTNPYASVYYASPGAATIEIEVLNWLKKLFSFPESAVGNLASGGSISTLIAFTAARDAHGIKNEKIRTSVVYLSKQVHHAAQKALRIIGLEDVILRYVPLDDHHRMDAGALEEMIQIDRESGLDPFLVIGTAGTTDTGAVDPLDALADISERYNLWYHIDAAYGGFFIMTSKKPLFKGIERADSLIVDPHKGLFIPYGLGAVLIRDKDAVMHSNYYSAGYMQDAADEELTRSASNLSPELTKHFRGLRLWLPLQLHGTRPFAACLEEKLLLLQYFRQLLLEKGFCAGPVPDLSVSYFWYPFTSDTDQRNKQLMDEMHRDGDVFFSSSIIDNRFVIRIAILSFRTKKETIDQAMQMIERCLQRVVSQVPS